MRWMMRIVIREDILYLLEERVQVEGIGQGRIDDAYEERQDYEELEEELDQFEELEDLERHDDHLEREKRDEKGYAADGDERDQSPEVLAERRDQSEKVAGWIVALVGARRRRAVAFAFVCCNEKAIG